MLRCCNAGAQVKKTKCRAARELATGKTLASTGFWHSISRVHEEHPHEHNDYEREEELCIRSYTSTTLARRRRLRRRLARQERREPPNMIGLHQLLDLAQALLGLGVVAAPFLALPLLSHGEGVGVRFRIS